LGEGLLNLTYLLLPLAQNWERGPGGEGRLAVEFTFNLDILFQHNRSFQIFRRVAVPECFGFGICDG
jgi:hypothetical protein